MTFPTGGPGGYPGQPSQPGYGPPQQGYGAPAGGRGGFTFGLAQILAAVVAVLGLVTLFLGFAPLTLDTGFYESGSGWIPGIVATAGLLGVLCVLPDKKGTRWGGLVLVANVGFVLPALFSFWSTDADLETGGIMVMIFAILQLLAAVALYLADAEIIKMPAKGPAGYPYGPGGPGGPGYGPPAGYGQQGYGQPGGFGQPAGQAGPTPSANQPTAQYPGGGGAPGTPPGGIGGQQG